MAHEKNHDYHILNPSLWPFLSALGAFILPSLPGLVGGAVTRTHESYKRQSM